MDRIQVPDWVQEKLEEMCLAKGPHVFLAVEWCDLVDCLVMKDILLSPDGQPLHKTDNEELRDADGKPRQVTIGDIYRHVARHMEAHERMKLLNKKLQANKKARADAEREADEYTKSFAEDVVRLLDEGPRPFVDGGNVSEQGQGTLGAVRLKVNDHRRVS